MFEALIIAGVIATSAILFYITFRPRKDIRTMARTLVRATEKRGEWDTTIHSEHIKRARVALILQDRFPGTDPEWLSIIIEEAVFDMEADRERCKSCDGSSGKLDLGLGAGPDGSTSGTDRDDSHEYLNSLESVGGRDAISATEWPRYEAGPEDLEIPSAE